MRARTSHCRCVLGTARPCFPALPFCHRASRVRQMGRTAALHFTRGTLSPTSPGAHAPWNCGSTRRGFRSGLGRTGASRGLVGRKCGGRAPSLHFLAPGRAVGLGVRLLAGFAYRCICGPPPGSRHLLFPQSGRVVRCGKRRGGPLFALLCDRHVRGTGEIASRCVDRTACPLACRNGPAPIYCSTC